MTSRRSRRGSPSSAASCSSRALDLQAEGRLELERAGRRGGDLRREDRPRRAPPRPRATGRRAGPRGPRPDAARRRLPGARRGRAPRACAGRAPVEAELPAGELRERGRRAAARLRARARCALEVVQPAGRQADGGRRLPARPPAAGMSAEQGGIAPARRSPTKCCGRPSSRTPSPSAPSARRPPCGGSAAASGPRRSARLRRGPAPRDQRRGDRDGSPTARRGCSTRR